MAKSYAALGKSDEAAKYEQLFQDIKAAFNKRYVAADGRIQGNTQCCYAMALRFDLLPEELRPKAAQYLEDDIKAKGWHLSTGFVGVSYLLPVLTEAGKTDTAYRLLMQDTFPSWLFSVKHGGHHDLGTLGRLDAGAGLPGPGHELVQSLLRWAPAANGSSTPWPASGWTPTRRCARPASGTSSSIRGPAAA